MPVSLKSLNWDSLTLAHDPGYYVRSVLRLLQDSDSGHGKTPSAVLQGYALSCYCMEWAGVGVLLPVKCHYLVELLLQFQNQTNLSLIIVAKNA